MLSQEGSGTRAAGAVLATVASRDRSGKPNAWMREVAATGALGWLERTH